ncbi:hypothetical protein [Paraburkholderia sp. RL17-337-BIB-A]|uniref:hypothetical protein n=1 Tax=Paraburkholderia sp. RL17-337-BIB-A TaxID=3031636 RepID=UPI0038BD8BAD
MQATLDLLKTLNPTIVSAVVAAAVSLLVGFWSPFMTGRLNLLTAQLRADTDAKLSESANSWAEYELRRNVYLEVATQVESIFADSGGLGVDAYLRTVRKLWLIAPDSVVQAANALSKSIRELEPQAGREEAYRMLFNAMRRDIRQRHLQPPVGTELGLDAFPIESARRAPFYGPMRG